MFAFARFVVRHKVGAAALVALGVFVMMPSEDEAAAEQSASPWSAQAATVQVAQAQESSFVGEVVDGTVAYLDEAGLNPLSASSESADRLNGTAGAVAKVNGN